MEGVNRQLLANYWTQERGKLSNEVLNREKGIVKKLLEWGNTEQRFTTSPTLITTLDQSKVFYKEPDPLEEHILAAIRDKLHVLSTKT